MVVSALTSEVAAGGGGGATLGIETREKGAGLEVWGCLEVHLLLLGAKGTGWGPEGLGEAAILMRCLDEVEPGKREDCMG